MAGALQFAGQKWSALNPGTPFTWAFLDYLFSLDYAQDTRIERMSGIFTIIAIFISCLGLLGLVTYSVAQRAREIGIRKVIGASVAGIVLLFTKQYLKLIVIANIIAWPLGWYFMDKWLQGFSYRIEISWWMFAFSLAAGVVVALGTITFKTVKAAVANPVESLRNE
jgi:putative ABC transport system permease protein